MVVVRVVTATINLIMKGVDKEWEIDEAKIMISRRDTYVGISTTRFALDCHDLELAHSRGASRQNNNGSKHGIES